MKKQHLQLLLVVVVLLAVATFFVFDLNQYLSFQYLQEQKLNFVKYYNQNTTLTLTLFFLIYVAVTSLSLPGAAVMTLAAGFLFGLFTGTALVSFASSIGATISFLLARFVLRESIQRRFSEKLKSINAGIEKDGVFYLITLRLIPAFPFFVINLVMGLTPMKTWKYYLTSQLAMLPGTIVYVNAGTQLSQLSSLKGIFSLELIISFALLGLFPLIAKKSVEAIRKRPA